MGITLSAAQMCDNPGNPTGPNCHDHSKLHRCHRSAPSREQLVENFGSRSKHLTWAEVRKRFDDLLKHGYADARRGFDGKWRLVLRKHT
jgi:hypothetical protein